MLQCAHHVCMVHVGNVTSRERLQCPVCSDVTLVPEGGLAVDRVLQVVVDRFEQSQRQRFQQAASAAATEPARSEPPLCGFCEEKIATSRCVQCSGALCEDCVQESHSKGFFKSHTIIDLEATTPRGTPGRAAADDKDNESQHMLCDVHAEEKLTFYCLDCRRPVCSHCLILGDHKGHQQTPIDQAFETGKETLGAWVDKLAQRMCSTEELIDRLRGTEIEMNLAAEGQRNVINKEMDHLRELIETKRHQLLSKSALEEKQKRLQLQAQLDRAEAARKEATDLVARSQGLLSLSSEHAFLAVVLPLIQDMKKCAGQSVDTAPMVSVAFRPLSTDSQVRSLGDLDLGHPRIPLASPQSQVAAAHTPPHMVSGIHSISGMPVQGISTQESQHQQHPSYSVVQPGHISATVGQLSYMPQQQAVPQAQQQPQPVAMAPQQVQYLYRTVPAA